MKIDNVSYFFQDELIRRLRNVTMLEDKKIYPYKDAVITSEYLDPKILTPPQNYLLSSALKNIFELEDAFLQHSKEIPYYYFDIFDLSGGFLEYGTCECAGLLIQRVLLPPIIEESIEEDGTVKLIICDGMHRVYASMIKHLGLINCIYIRGVNKRCPYYAYPVINEWDGVKVIDRLEPGLIKKFHRIKDNKKLYRNFDSVFNNCSAPRGCNS